MAISIRKDVINWGKWSMLWDAIWDLPNRMNKSPAVKTPRCYGWWLLLGLAHGERRKRWKLQIKTCETWGCWRKFRTGNHPFWIFARVHFNCQGYSHVFTFSMIFASFPWSGMLKLAAVIIYKQYWGSLNLCFLLSKKNVLLDQNIPMPSYTLVKYSNIIPHITW